MVKFKCDQDAAVTMRSSIINDFSESTDLFWNFPRQILYKQMQFSV